MSVPAKAESPAPQTQKFTASELAGLGRDIETPELGEVPQEEPESAEPEQAEQPEAPPAKTYSPDQIALLEERAASYEWITKQPDLMEVMANHLKTKANPQQQKAPAADDRLRTVEQTQAQLIAELELTQFMVRNPVLVNDEKALNYWAGLVKDGLSKEKAFDLTKRDIEHRQASKPKAPRLAGSERGQAGGERKPSTGRWDAKIASARSGGDAIEAALNAVLEERAARS